MNHETKFAYIAGLIDADGTIGIRRFNNSTGQLHYRPMIEVTNMSVEIMAFLEKTFGNARYFERNRKYKTGGIFTWRVTGSNCRRVLDSVGPYLVYKKKQASNCMELVSRIGHRGTYWSDEKRLTENTIRHQLYLRAKELNHH